MDASIKIKGETKIRNVIFLVESPLKDGNTKLMIPEEHELDISAEDYKKLESKLWSMYFNKAISCFYKNPSSLSLIKTVSQNLKYLRWRENLSFFEGAKALGASLYTLYKLENGKSTNLKRINSGLLKMIYSIEKHELYIARNFVKAVNLEFMSNGYLEEKGLNDE